MVNEFNSKLNVVIVNYCAPGLVINCVNSILRQDVALVENIIVVDNASPDDSVSVLENDLPVGVRFIKSDTNNGYSSGVNIGSRLADNDYLLILNPDTYFVDSSIQGALNLLNHDSSIGLVGLDLRYPDGKRQYSARKFYCVADIVARRTFFGKFWPFKKMLSRHMMIDAWDSQSVFDADWVMGTGLIINKKLYDRIGGMDESFFLYMEDVDLCIRVWAAGYRVVCIPEVKLIHDHQRASGAGVFSWAGRMHLRSLRLFSRKYNIPFFRSPKIAGLIK